MTTGPPTVGERRVLDGKAPYSVWLPVNDPAKTPPPAAVKQATVFRVSPRPAEQTGLPLWIVAVISVVVVTVCYVTFNARSPDPDYVRAVKLVADFELAKPPDAINYLDPIYAEALADLDRVGSTSISAGPASALSLDIRTKQKAFTERQREKQARMDADHARRSASDEALFEAQRTTTGTDSGAAARVAAIPAPECAEDAASRKRRAAENGP